ncbi:uncharacterized protein [Diabrotica undecimpunctata]|uniref:uncharacterized protein n=1 Tax=Diabrotica undecimpunctata TaxID=50387 RepID=UPI003B63F160
MFYDIILLNSQHKAQFSKAWIAGTRGIKFIKETEIKAMDIRKLCDNIIQYVITTSTAPKKRFSLRLSTILTYGAIKIYREQVIILQGQCSKAIQFVNIPIGISDDEIITTPYQQVPSDHNEQNAENSDSDEWCDLEEDVDGDDFVLRKNTLVGIEPHAVQKPIDFFSHFVFDEILDIIVNETNISAVQQLNMRHSRKSSIRFDEIGVTDVISSLSPVAKVVRKKRTKKSKIIETPDVLQAMEQALLDEQTPIHLEPAAEAGFSNKIISIIEEVKETARQQPDEEFLSLGPALNVDDILLETGYPKPRAGSSSSIPIGTVGPQITVVADVHVSRVSPVPDTTPSTKVDHVEKRHTVIEDIITEAEMPLATEIPPIAASTPNGETAAAAKRAVPPGVLKEIQVVEQIQEDRAEKRTEFKKPVEERRVVSKKKGLPIEEQKRIFLTTSSARFIRINRCIDLNEEIFVMEYTPSPIECSKKDLIYLYQPEEGHSQTDLEQALLTVSSSLERTDRARGTLSLPSITEELIVPRTTLEEQPKLSVTSSPKGKDRPTSLEPEYKQSITTTPKGRHRGPSEELMMIDASPRKKARKQLIPDESRPSDKTQEAPSAMEIELPEVIPSQRSEFLTPILEEREVLPSSPFKSLKLSPQTTADYKKRQQRIVDLVTKFNFDEGFPTIEDLSEKPLNKFHVARCFHDLLVLCATKYLILVPEDDCIELKYIKKGPKFIN